MVFPSGAKFIGCDVEGSGLPVFRKVFSVEGGLLSATLYATALGVYNAYLNGRRIGSYELEPGFDEMALRKSYTEYDVTPLILSGGRNVLAAVVGSGWWTGRVAACYGKQEAFLATLVLRYRDGSEEIISTDESWKSARESAVLFSDIYDGETCDARITEDWKFAAFDDKSWHHVRINTEFSGEIVPWQGPHITVKEELARRAERITVYRGATEADENCYGKINVMRTYQDEPFTLNAGETALIDFGQNFSGREAFTVEGGRGTELTIRHGEMLNDCSGEKSRGNFGAGGSLLTANYRSAKATTRYILRGEGKEHYHPSFTYCGFQFIEITATDTVTFSCVTGQVLSSVTKRTGRLTTSHPLLNKLIENIFWGQLSNYVSVPTDCPQRDERMGWTADTQVFAETGCYLADSQAFLEKYLVCLRDAQGEDGSFSGVAPTGGYRGSRYGGTGWADAGVMIPHTLWRMYGDTKVIKEHWDAMQKFVDGYLSTTNGMGGQPHWGDWLSYEPNDEQIREILGVAYYAWDAKNMAEMADAIGKVSDAARYRDLYEKEKALFIVRYVKNGKLIRGEQSVLAHALYLDLLPDKEVYKKVASQLVENLERNGRKLQTGFLGTKILLDTLTKLGRNDIAYSVLLSEQDPSWLYSVNQGATTVWERWNSYTKERGFGDVNMNSFNHYAYGAVAAWMFRTMAGIGCAEPGFKKIRLAPCPDQRIACVSASYESAVGMISARSEWKGDTWSYSVKLPASVKAELVLPAGFFRVTLNGRLLAPPPECLEIEDCVLLSAELKR